MMAGLASRRQSIDPTLRRDAHRLLDRLKFDLTQQAPLRRGGSVPLPATWDGRGGEIDLDRTVDAIALGDRLDDEDFMIRRSMTTSQAVMLVVDVSGSMRGERVRTAAAAIACLISELSEDAVGVLAFWSDAAVVLDLDDSRDPSEVLDELLDIDARGLTNVGFALTTAADQLWHRPEDDVRIVMLTDAVHNAGPDPRTVVTGGPRVDVLLDTSEEHDARIARDISRLGGGRCEPVATASDIPAALARIFHD